MPEHCTHRLRHNTDYERPSERVEYVSVYEGVDDVDSMAAQTVHGVYVIYFCGRFDLSLYSS